MKYLFIFLLFTTPAFAAHYADIDNTNTVVNVIEWDGKGTYTPPPGDILVQSDTAVRYETYDPVQHTFTYVAPPPAPPITKSVVK